MDVKMHQNELGRFNEHSQKNTKPWMRPIAGGDGKTSQNGNEAYHRYKELNLNPSCLTLKDLIDKLYAIFESDCVNVEEVHALMSSYKSNPAEWLKYAKFDRYRYTRNLVDAGNGKFNLMVLCWGEGQGSSIHDHADAHCFMKMLAGSLSEIRYKWPNIEQRSDDSDFVQPLEEISRASLNTDEVCYINDSIGLHRVENLSYSDCAVSLHLYCPPFESCKVFDLRTGRSTNSKVTFWSMFGERKKASEAKKLEETTSKNDETKK